MLQDLDATVAEVVRRGLPPALSQQVSVSFATPDGNFPPSYVSLPTINFFLYGIQENRELRNLEPTVQRQASGRVTSQRGPARIDCQYMVSAWAKQGLTAPEQDEHRILGAVMQVLLRYREIPTEMLQGSMTTQAFLPRALIFQAIERQARAELFAALGGRPRAVFDYTVTVSVEVFEAQDVGRVTGGLGLT